MEQKRCTLWPKISAPWNSARRLFFSDQRWMSGFVSVTFFTSKPAQALIGLRQD
jgi:hypothetical protein